MNEQDLHGRLSIDRLAANLALLERLHTTEIVGSVPTPFAVSLVPAPPMTNPLSLRPGDRVPDFALPGLDGKLRKFIWSFTGAPVVLVAVDDLVNLDGGQFAPGAAGDTRQALRAHDFLPRQDLVPRHTGLDGLPAGRWAVGLEFG
jgi:hypothetical protein